MIHVQSSYFPLVDRNPQQFMDIPKARDEDFRVATQRNYRAGEQASTVTVRVESGRFGGVALRHGSALALLSDRLNWRGLLAVVPRGAIRVSGSNRARLNSPSSDVSLQ